MIVSDNDNCSLSNCKLYALAHVTNMMYRFRPKAKLSNELLRNVVLKRLTFAVSRKQTE